MKGKYDDIINLPHHISSTRPQMSRRDRAAQFSAFAALTGYDAAIKKTARPTDSRIELDEYEKSMLDEKMRIISEEHGENIEVKITYFSEDNEKEGGSYIEISGFVKKIERCKRTLIMNDGRQILVDDIVDIESYMFERFE